MKPEIIQILTAGIGALGFSIYFRVNEKHVAASTIGGALGWAIYLIIFKLTNMLFFANFVAALIVYLYSEIMARLLKAPSNIFLVPGTIPLIPGGALYYTMYGVVDGDKQLFITKATQTVEITFGIAAGIVVGTVIMIYIMKIGEKRKKRKNK